MIFIIAGHATATDMMEKVDHVFDQLRTDNLVQISMDGPSVNWKFHRLFNERIHNEHGVSLVNVGSCGLHTVHNSFQTGGQASGWKVSSLLSSLYYLFKDSPARREDYCKVTGGAKLPLKFVNHRWLENGPVVTRTLEIWPSIVLYVQAVWSKTLPHPGNKSFRVVSAAVKDKLLKAKLLFFKAMAELCHPFLEDFQTERPVMPFMCEALTSLLRALMCKVIKPEVLDKARTASKLSAVNVSDSSLHMAHNKLDVGFLTQKAVTAANASDRSVLEFRMECKDFIVKILTKLLEKSPISFKLLRALSCLNPCLMVSNPASCRSNFKVVMDSLLQSNRVTELNCEAIIRDYEAFLDNIPQAGSDDFSSFSWRKDRLDDFLLPRVKGQFDKLVPVLRILLILSHGQAAVERGFSVNKELEVENLQEKSLVAQRLVCEYVKLHGGVSHVPLTKPLLHSASMAHQRYKQHLDQLRDSRKTEEQTWKRKTTLDMLEVLKTKKRWLCDDITTLQQSADELSEKAERTTKNIKEVLGFVTQSNSFRKSAKEKDVQLKETEAEIESKLQELKELWFCLSCLCWNIFPLRGHTITKLNFIELAQQSLH